MIDAENSDGGFSVSIEIAVCCDADLYLHFLDLIAPRASS